MTDQRPPRQRDPTVTSRMMAAVRNKDSKAEWKIRRRLHAMGVRYRLHHKIVGRPDIVFPRQRIAVFIDGDFWHGNAWRLRGLASLADLFPTRTDWWVAKITRNMERDADVTRTLRLQGWLVLRFWESDVEKDVDAVSSRIVQEVGRIRARAESGSPPDREE